MRRGPGERSGVDVSFNQCGSLLLARTPGRLDELRLTASVARLEGIPAPRTGPDEVAATRSLASTTGLLLPAANHLLRPSEDLVPPA